MAIEPYMLPVLHTPEMNDTHFETVLLINALSEALRNGTAQEVGERLDALLGHTREHYRAEEARMVETKFPPYPAHKEEHDDALGAMENAAAAFARTQDVDALTRYVDGDLIPTFLRHTETMDAVTSIFLENSEAHLPFWERLVPRH